MTHHLIDPVVLHKQYTPTLVTESALHLIIHLLLRQGDLLRRVLVAVRAHLSFLLRVEDDGKLARLKWLEDEAQLSLFFESVVVVIRRLLHDLPLLSQVGDDDELCCRVRR